MAIIKRYRGLSSGDHSHPFIKTLGLRFGCNYIVLSALTSVHRTTRRSQSIKMDTDISINKSVKLVKIDLIDIDCIDQSVEIDNTGIFFIDFC